MNKFIKKYMLILLLSSFTTFAVAEDFSEMSTQELIAIMGYVKDKNKKEFQSELKNRIKSMSSKERKAYEKNLEKLKK